MRQKSLVMRRAVLVFILLLLFLSAFTVYGEGDTGINLERRVKQFTETMDGKEYVLSSCEYDVINTTQSPSLGLKLFLAKYNEMTAREYESHAEGLQNMARRELSYTKRDPKYVYNSELALGRADTKALSFIVKSYTYMGGVGTTIYKLHNIDALTGKSIDTAKFVSDYDVLSRKVTEKIVGKQKPQGNDTFLERMKEDVKEHITKDPNAHLVMLEQGLGIYFSKYVLESIWAAEVVLSLEDLEGIVDLGPYK